MNMANPITFAGRVLLWIFAWPLGLWRSLRHGQKKDARRASKLNGDAR